MANFKLGDVVRLKSGGPIMTITLVAEANSTHQTERWAFEAYKNKFGLSSAYYGCVWFVGNKKEDGAFPEEAITIANQDNGNNNKYCL